MVDRPLQATSIWTCSWRNAEPRRWSTLCGRWSTRRCIHRRDPHAHCRVGDIRNARIRHRLAHRGLAQVRILVDQVALIDDQAGHRRLQRAVSCLRVPLGPHVTQLASELSTFTRSTTCCTPVREISSASAPVLELVAEGGLAYSSMGWSEMRKCQTCMSELSEPVSEPLVNCSSLLPTARKKTKSSGRNKFARSLVGPSAALALPHEF